MDECWKFLRVLVFANIFTLASTTDVTGFTIVYFQCPPAREGTRKYRMQCIASAPDIDSVSKIEFKKPNLYGPFVECYPRNNTNPCRSLRGQAYSGTALVDRIRGTVDTEMVIDSLSRSHERFWNCDMTSDEIAESDQCHLLVYELPQNVTCDYIFVSKFDTVVVTCSTPKVFPEASCTWKYYVDEVLQDDQPVGDTQQPRDYRQSGNLYYESTCSLRLNLPKTGLYSVQLTIFPVVAGKQSPYNDAFVSVLVDVVRPTDKPIQTTPSTPPPSQMTTPPTRRTTTTPTTMTSSPPPPTPMTTTSSPPPPTSMSTMTRRISTRDTTEERVLNCPPVEEGQLNYTMDINLGPSSPVSCLSFEKSYVKVSCNVSVKTCSSSNRNHMGSISNVNYGTLASMTIQTVSRTDEGDWMCRMTTGSKVNPTAACTVSVYVYPRDVNCTSTVDGQFVRATCVAEKTYPKGDCLWKSFVNDYVQLPLEGGFTDNTPFTKSGNIYFKTICTLRVNIADIENKEIEVTLFPKVADMIEPYKDVFVKNRIKILSEATIIQDAKDSSTSPLFIPLLAAGVSLVFIVIIIVVIAVVFCRRRRALSPGAVIYNSVDRDHMDPHFYNENVRSFDPYSRPANQLPGSAYITPLDSNLYDTVDDNESYSIALSTQPVSLNPRTDVNPYLEVVPDDVVTYDKLNDKYRDDYGPV